MFKKVNIVFLPLCIMVLMAIFEPFANADTNEKIDDVSNGIESVNFTNGYITGNTDFSDSQMITPHIETGTSTTPFGGLSGYIYNSSTNVIIPRARVSLSGVRGYKYTDSTGWYNIAVVQGTYSVRASRTRYYRKIIRNVYIPGSGKWLDIYLTPRPSKFKVQNRDE